MSLRNAIYSALTGVSPAIDVWPDQAPQNAGLPRFVFLFVAGEDSVLLDGYGTTGRRTVQVDAWANDPDIADAMIEDAKAALAASTAFSVGSVNETGATGYDEDGKLYRASRDFSLHYDI